MHCNKNNLRTMTQSAVVSCKKRMKRMVVPITKHPQRSLDKMSNWAQARFGWVTQLQIRLGLDVCLDLFLEESTGFEVPPWFDKEWVDGLNGMTGSKARAQLDGLDGHARLNRGAQLNRLNGLNLMGMLNLTGSTQRAQLDGLDSTRQSARCIASLARSSLGARSPPHPLSSPTPWRWRLPRITAAPPSRNRALGCAPPLFP
jgi:hypothetical protein